MRSTARGAWFYHGSRRDRRSDLVYPQTILERPAAHERAAASAITAGPPRRLALSIFDTAGPMMVSTNEGARGHDQQHVGVAHAAAFFCSDAEVFS